jgi:hypothetical protein
VLTHLTALRRLDVAAFVYERSGVHHIDDPVTPLFPVLPALSCITSLEYLDVSAYSLTFLSIEAAATPLACLTQLSALRARSCVGSLSIASILTAAATGLGALRELDLQASQVFGTDTLAEALLALPHVTALILCDVQLAPSGAQWTVGASAAVASALVKLSNLQLLEIGMRERAEQEDELPNLCEVAMTPPAMRALSLGVPAFKAVDDVCQALCDGWLPAARKAACHTSLLSLELSDSQFGTDIGLLLPSSPEAFPKLQWLDVQRCGADTQGFEALGRQLQEAWGDCPMVASGDGVYAIGEPAPSAQSFAMDDL